jgi:CHAT domain-containing protein
VSSARGQIDVARSEVHSPFAGELEKQLNRTTGRLYDIIFAPLESHLGIRTDLFVAPDGQLSLLPLEILPCPDGKYAIEKYGISYLSSGRDLLRFDRAPKGGGRAVILADPAYEVSEQALADSRSETLGGKGLVPLRNRSPRGVSGCLNAQFSSLPVTREEAESVAETLRRMTDIRVDSYYGSHALEEVLKSMTTAPRLLHIATHGYFCKDQDLAGGRMLENPLLRSGLALAGANRVIERAEEDTVLAEDGVLTAFEASSLNLVGTELVTLSACESGVGDVKNGEGVYGLRRALQHAGAHTVVMSLWKVPDIETSELMRGFYEKWMTGNTRKEALRHSVLEVLNACRAKHGMAHPLVWGGFVLAGDPD